MPTMRLCLLLQMCCLYYARISAQNNDDCRILKFKSAMEGHYLQGHVFKSLKVQKENDCDAQCYIDSSCISCNVVSSPGDGKLACELSTSDHEMNPESLLRRFGSTYHPIENACLTNPCTPQSTCQNGYTDKGYRCKNNTQGTQAPETTQSLQTTSSPPTTPSTQTSQSPQTASSPPTTPSTQTTQSPQTTSSPQTDPSTQTTPLTQTASSPPTTSSTQTAQSPPTTPSTQTNQSPQTTSSPQTDPSTQTTPLTQTASSPPTTESTQTTESPQTTSPPETDPSTQTTPLTQTDPSPRTTLSPQPTSEPQTTKPHVGYPETCSKVKETISDANGLYVIDPDGPDGKAPFQVYCNMTDKGGVGVTVVRHDTENRTHVDGCEPKGCYSRDVTYAGVTFSQLIALTDVSNYCEQFISYECKNSRLLDGGTAWWVSRDELKMEYWGGTTKKHECACALTRTCAKNIKKCNCDVNDDVWREDSGLLTDKFHLPVSQLRFGDTGTEKAEGYHTLGSLKCYGMS